MRKTTLFFVFIFSTIYVFAAPSYGTRLADKNKFFVGLENHTILKRELEADFGNVRSQQEFFKLSYGLFEWLSLDLKIGIGSIRQHPVGGDEVDYSTSFGGGYGYRLKLLRHKNTKVVFGFQHISIHPYSSETGETKNQAILDDWQYSFLVSHKIKRLDPYLGVRWSRLDYIHRFDSDHKRKMSILSKPLGLIAGLDLSITKKSWVNLEGQFLDGKAFSLSLNYGF